MTAGKYGGGCSIEGDGLRTEGEFLVVFDLCRGRLENRVLETALVSFCGAHDKHEGGVEYDTIEHIATRTRILFCAHRDFVMDVR